MKRVLFVLAILCMAVNVMAQTPVVNPTKLSFTHPTVDFAKSTLYRMAIFPFNNGTIGPLTTEIDIPKASIVAGTTTNEYVIDITTIVNGLSDGTYTATLEALVGSVSSGRSAPVPVPFLRVSPPSKPVPGPFR